MEKLQQLKYIVIGMIIASVAFTSIQVTYADFNSKTITILKGINLYIDDVKHIPKDASGNIVEPFLYNGTTYLPVRAIGEAVGKAITWEQSTQSVYIGRHDSNKPTIMLNEMEPIYLSDSSTGWSTRLINSSKTVSDNIGNEYPGHIGVSYAGTYATIGPVYKIDGKYNTIKGKYILFSGGKNTTYQSQIIIYGDDKQLYKSPVLKKGAEPVDFEVDISGVSNLKIIFSNNGGQDKFGLVNAGLYQ